MHILFFQISLLYIIIIIFISNPFIFVCANEIIRVHKSGHVHQFGNYLLHRYQ